MCGDYVSRRDTGCRLLAGKDLNDVRASGVHARPQTSLVEIDTRGEIADWRTRVVRTEEVGTI